MSEDQNTSTQDGNNSSDATSGAGDGFKPITSQEDLNRVIADRISRERSKFADYEDLQAKAAKLDDIEAANKSELEKATETATAAEQRAAAAEAEALRWKVAAKHGISDEDAELFLTGTDEETLTAQATRLADRTANQRRNGTRSPNEGKAPADAKATTADQFAEWAESQFTH